MIVPLWAVFGLVAAALSAAMMLLQERIKVEGFALAYWNKIMCALVTLPLVLVHGLPHDLIFYLALGASCIRYSISDVIFFRSIPKVGAGIVSRLMPVSVIVSFLLWFVVDPALLHKYIAAPVVSVGIVCVLGLWAWFATHLKKCAVSMRAVKIIWFVIFAAIIGAPLVKIAVLHAGIEKGPYAFAFVGAVMMLGIWTVYYAIRRPIPLRVLFSYQSCLGGALIGCVAAGTVVVSVMAYYYVDNPAYVPAVRYLDSVLILLVYALAGRKNDGNIRAGIGVAACAAALIILKAQIH